jgi:hypothetical protein
MLEVRDVEVMNARREAVRAAAISSNDFLPAGFDREAAMHAQGFLEVVHAHCLRYSKEQAPSGLLGLRKPPRTGYSDQLQRKREAEALIQSVTTEERLELNWLYSLGFPADLIFLFYPRPSLKYEILAGVLQNLDGKVRRSNCEGRLLTLSGLSAEDWLSDAEIVHMVSVMAKVQSPAPTDNLSRESYAINRLAKVFMSLSRQGEVSKRKMSSCEEGTLPLWRNFVGARCAGASWIGSQWGWNPLIVSEKSRIRQAYASLQAADDTFAVRNAKRELELQEEVRQVRTRIAEQQDPLSSAAKQTSTPHAALTSTDSTTAFADPMTTIVARGGNHPWSKRRDDFLQILSSKYPNFELDISFDEDGWSVHVKGKDSRVSGICKVCKTANSATVSHIIGTQGLPKCKGQLCRDLDLKGPHQNPEIESIEDEEEYEELKPKLNHHSDFDDVMSFMEKYHPHIRLRGNLMTRSGWEEAIKSQDSAIDVTCLLCGENRKSSSQNILYNGQGFCTFCTRLQTGYKKALAVLDGLVRLSNPHMRSQADGPGQRYCHVDVECMIKDCGWKGTLCTRAYAGILKKNPQAKIVPCKKCNNVEPWRSAAGFQNFLRVLEFYQETRYYKAAITLEEWLQKVVNLKSKVPVQCAICDEIREVRISNIQQGASVGCGCFRSSYALEAELAKIIPSVIVRREVKLHGGLKMDFAYFFEGNSVINQEQYQKACHDLRVVPQTQPVKIGIELDGRQHFSGIIFSEHNEQIGLRDLKKDAIACESNVSLIRLQQTSVWENVPYWKDFLREALTYAVSHSGGRVLCEDVANYTESGQYASMRSSGKLSTLRRSEKLPHGVIRELMASSCK